MGTFYGSIHVRTEKSDEVQKALDEVAKAANCKFLVGPPVKGWISVFPDNGGQGDETSIETAKRLPCDIFHLVVHDDDIFSYYFYRNGRLIDQYNSRPDYFGEVSEEEKQQCRGRPELFQDLLRKPESLNKLKTLLAANQEKYSFEQERMEQFVELLGLSNALSSYEYLQSGERDGIKGWKQFVHVPDLSAEKAAKGAAQAKIKGEKKLLQKEGVLFAEIKPPKRKGPGLPISITWGTGASNGFLLAWHSYPFIKSTDNERSVAGLFTIQPPWNSLLPLPGLVNNFSAYCICLSPSSKWLAGGFGAGDSAMRVWDWQRKELAFEVTHTSAASWLAFSEDEQLVYSLSDELIVTSMTERRPVITIKGVAGGRAAAVHPSGKFIAVALQDGLALIDVAKEKLIKKLWVNRHVENMDRWSGLSDKQVVEKLLQNPEKLKRLRLDSPRQIESWVAENRFIKFETKEHVFDLCFSPDGEQLFVAGGGMRVFAWGKLLSANEDAPAPEMSVDAPRDDENDPNSRPLAYCVRFDPERKLLLSSCLAGVIQYLNVSNGQSGTLLKLPGAVMVWRLELTSDRKALCCQSATRPRAREDRNKIENCLQVWNYPALCEAAGLN
jgi:WD40 repeat protein